MENDNLMMKNISYLRARDPSILSFNRPGLSAVKTNLIDEFGEFTQQEEEKQTEDNIRVYLRIKHGYDFQDLYEIVGNSLVSKVPSGSSCLRNTKEGDSMKKTYSFTKIFQSETTQTGIFNCVVKQKILDFINGQNSTLLTYGASGSGKTFTLLGTDEEPGVVPRSLEYLFRTLPQLPKSPLAKLLPTGNVTLLGEADRKKEKLLCQSLLNASSSSIDRTQHIKTYMTMQQRLSNEPVAELEDFTDVTIAVWVSFAEIYNEQIYDLLQLDPPRGHQRPRLRLGMSNGQPYIKNLTNVSVTSGQEAYEILQFGLHNLNYAPTQINQHSSRSHSIFTITLVQLSTSDGGSCVSSFKFCDLAGSERSKKTHNVGDRLKESNNINSSLLVLGRCISAVRNMQKQKPIDQKLVPYRESKLTQLFQRALAGAEDIAMIVSICPSREMFDESQHVLNFSAIAKEICIERKPEPVRKKNRFSQLVEGKSDFSADDYKTTIQTLQDELEQQKCDFEVTQQMNMNYLREEYDKLLKIKDAEIHRKMERLEKTLKLKYDAKIENLKNKYERIIEDLEQRNPVIEITSSDEDDDEDKKIRDELNKSEILKEILDEGVADYKELKEKYDELLRENLDLRENLCRMENELSVYKAMIECRLLENESSDSEQKDASEERNLQNTL